MKSSVAFENLVPVPAQADALMTGVRQVMGLAMAMSLLAVVIVMLGMLA